MHLTLHLTTACNLRCDYCYAPPQDGHPMSFATACHALELGARLTGGSCGIVFFGGEPLLCKDLIREVVDRARAMERYRAGRFHFKITTNGVLLDDAFLEFSQREDVFIAMSFDGVQAAHDSHRRAAAGSGTHAFLLGQLRKLLAVRPYASVLMVVNPDTASRLAESVTALLDEGARYLVVSMNYAAAWAEEDMEVLREQYEALAGLYANWTLEGRRFYLSPFEVKFSSHINRHCYHKERCELAQHQLSVDPEGWLFPCVQFTRAGPASHWCIGHVDRGIDEAARGRIYRESQQEKEPCRGCAIRDRCNHTCGCLNWQATGDLNGICPALCRHEQMLLPIVDRLGRDLFRRKAPHFLHKHYNAAYPVLSLLEDGLR